MATNSNRPASSSPPKPWEQVGSASGPVPFKPSSPGSTSDVVEASGTAKPGEIVSAAGRNTAINRNALGRPVPARPWEQQTYGNTYGGYGANLNYNSGFGAGMYGSYGGYGASYGGGLYGNNMYRGTNGLYGGTGMYGGGTFNNGFGGPMGSYRMSMGMGGPFGDQDLNNPHDGSPSPPGFWISILRVMHGVVNFFGRISILIDQNTQAFHMFMTALLQLFDRSGVLYGELARFVMRLLGIKTKPRKIHPQGPEHVQGPSNAQNFIDGPKAALSGGWDSVWRENAGH